ncbi:GNAT family N-acetyltransferase [Marivibrio halodurans]|uniref:GNAT family N-acetyltransferase n=1 Tax=Marivibrio halodurans TaxID=2039722 RepID=A0A8J7V0D1_9PROT|nr:GNAT family N-acetyltransferase [Marivibrio halodurans]MBP5856681.1 GNAT family N-acetyltransferase [Marivibrio halodurans]
MIPILRSARPGEADRLSALVMRSKAYWGYDAAFLEKCLPALRVSTAMIRVFPNRVAEIDGYPAGFAMIDSKDDPAEVLLLFVEPSAMGRGIGRALFTWLETEARRAGRAALRIEADPGAVPFYERCGARRTGAWAPSEADAARYLPVLVRSLRGDLGGVLPDGPGSRQIRGNL